MQKWNLLNGLGQKASSGHQQQWEHHQERKGVCNKKWKERLQEDQEALGSPLLRKEVEGGLRGW